MVLTRYKLVFHRATGAGFEVWPHGFSSAKEHARNMVHKGLAQKVEIQDDVGRRVFQYPKADEPKA